MITRHHANWRLQCVEALNTYTPSDLLENLHYSSVVTLAAKDVEILRARLVRVIEESKDVIRTSPEEQVRVLALDFYDPTSSSH